MDDDSQLSFLPDDSEARIESTRKFFKKRKTKEQKQFQLNPEIPGDNSKRKVGSILNQESDLDQGQTSPTDD